ncbi:uncharacterized protein N7506_005480 [Penicillium brevicompactum]|uniref:uncharacterized protein n=1 Tax=Penicillium brevicompactum TaxID=5074 RepID=UPI0025410000|nr:uncharacterized protein N7506_005480 [Penicillium brevicompactum]KAJ5337458.1 hypothetical protein N7506_005480 [Penicillium brevicompactum]
MTSLWLVGASNDLITSQVHRNLDYPKTLPGIQFHDNNSSTMVAALQHQAYTLIEGPVETMKKDLNADSHELAHEIPDVRGAIQKEYPKIPDPMIGDYTNGELFAFIRRFNKDVFDVKAVSIETSCGLDLNDAWSQDHAGDKLGLHLQRVYLTVILGIASLGKQISRLRSWKETCRTSMFCAVYFAAWLFDLLMPLALGIIIMVVSPVEVRNILFPSAPRALVNIRTGGIQKPQAGLLGTNDTLIGAPEKQPHEAIEEEAANFVDKVRHNIQRAVGMHKSQQQDGDGDPLEGKPMEEIIWAGVNPETIANILDIAPQVIGELADNWERFASALLPTPSFARFAFIRIVADIAPLFLLSLFVNYYMVYKGIGCLVGFVIFGDPMLTPTIAWLKRNVPKYKELAQPKNNFLRGVPTNSQIAITLLRIGEAHKTPLPPVNTSNHNDPDHQNPIEAENIPLGATSSDVLDATMPSIVEKVHGDDDEEKPNHKHLSKIVRFFKGNAQSIVETKLAIDHVRAATGSQKAKGHLGVLPKTKRHHLCWAERIPMSI